MLHICRIDGLCNRGARAVYIISRFRCYASNWPVSDLYAKYETVYALAVKYVEGKGKGAFAKVFGSNAVVAYRLPKR